MRRVGISHVEEREEHSMQRGQLTQMLRWAGVCLLDTAVQTGAERLW